MTKPTYEKVWHLTVGELKTYPIFVLKCMKKDIKAENTRVSLALRWIRKNHIADLIVSLCEHNLYGNISVTLSPLVKV